MTRDLADAAAVPAPELLNLGVEEEFHVVDLDSRELVPRAPEILDHLPAASFSPELHRSVLETNTKVHIGLERLRDELIALRRQACQVADALGLGIVAAGTVPLVDVEELAVTPNARFERMLDDYQLLAREQLICGAQVHVGIPDRDVAVAVAQRVSQYLPALLAISASSPFWMGEDTGYSSIRSLLWQRWPTAGASGLVETAEDHDSLVAELIASGTITDPGMIYFDVRPSAHVPTIELRVTDACPSVDTVVLLAGLFRALVRRERDAVANRYPLTRIRGPLQRAAMWRAARSGLEGDLVDLSGFARPVPAGEAIRSLVGSLRPQLEAAGDWEYVSALAGQALARGSAADRQRRVFARRGRLADVVDMLLAETRAGGAVTVGGFGGQEALLAGYQQEQARGDEVIASDGSVVPVYEPMLQLLERLGAGGIRDREKERDAEQRSHRMTFRVAGETTARLFPLDVIPRIVSGEDWEALGRGLVQRARALDAFLKDVYADREVVEDGVIPAWVVDGAPGLLPLAALIRQPVRAHIAGMDLVHDAAGNWSVLEDNLRVPSGLGYSVANRRLTDHIWPDLPRPAGLHSVETLPALLRSTLEAAAPPRTSTSPQIVVLSQGPVDSAWFEHQLLAEEMGVPVVRTTDLVVDDRTVYLHRHGTRRRVDVIYLRLDEDTLVHAPAGDGRPLGPPLLSAVGAGTVTLANAPGNGVGDDKAIYAYVPDFIEYYLGEKPILAHVPTYLCGDAEQRDEVLRRLGELVVKPVDGYGGEGVLIGPRATEEELDAVRRQIKAAPHRWIAQETMHLSTHPVFDGNRLTPRHVDLRAFVFMGENPTVAPAALTRVAPEGSLVVNSSRGGGAKDTWIL
ncbi:carboxylate--amine ligase/circularly permuted type 2 ATP-grasp protein [Cryptosporangium arvum]|uniref:carboxylate--amine ligase/circularly permuted type 2 ATP-grasp protein n=1 Tax=Cryptosporangium arvum TaxID=80871 RepID=UPI001B7FFBB9|nr:carboxylate--amine ligase/circularly permuted type 2 ATP-grasp protein [Cryptosporangium arvum]